MIKRHYIIPLAIFAVTIISCSRNRFTAVTMAKAIRTYTHQPYMISPYITSDEYPAWEYPANLTSTFEIIERNRQQAIAAVTITDTAGRGFTRYMYFVKDSAGWKPNATARPTLERLHHRRLREMEEMTPAQIDSMLTAAQHQEAPPYKTREEFDFVRNSLRLKLAPDDTLIAHFHKHKAAFNRLRKAAADSVQLFMTLHAGERRKKIATDQALSESNTLVPTQTTALNPLLISNVTTYHVLPAGQFDFHILYDQVGYLYAPKKKYRPVMSQDGVIVLRDLGKGWYLYKVQVYL